MKFYKNNSNPLEQVKWPDLKDGELYITDEGMRFLCESDGSSFKVIKHSALVPGEVVTDLSSKLLEMYWKFMNTAIDIERED